MTEAVNMGFLQKILKAKTKEDKAAAHELERLKKARSIVREELEISMNNYNHVKDDGLMDFYIYRIRSQQALEEYLIREIRKIEKEIS